MMTREEHLDWAKRRATQLCDQGDLVGAFASLASNLNKHPETRDHRALELMMRLWIGGNLKTPAVMREFIEGFR